MKLIRFAYFTDRTLGQLHHQDKTWWTIERPWLDNQPNVSCIPTGTYPLERVDSPRFGPRMWQISRVPDRTHILIHVANTADNVMGCVGLGTGLYGDLAGVASSRNAITAFYDLTSKSENYSIIVIDGVIKEE
jgi:hypothetical protein|tara:strand:+ start:15301 stop:15699 length:399 start_codon:yes stop_codon:yes gene_type:complete